MTIKDEMMGVNVDWDDADHTVVRLTFQDDWTLEDLRAKGTDTILMIRTVDHPVYVISDFSQSANLPIGVLWQARDLNQMRPKNWQAGIMITSDKLARNLLELFGVVYMGKRQKQLYVVHSIEEAYETINQLKTEK